MALSCLRDRKIVDERRYRALCSSLDAGEATVEDRLGRKGAAGPEASAQRRSPNRETPLKSWIQPSKPSDRADGL